MARTVSGKVYDESGLPVAGLELLARHVGFRGQDVELGRDTTGTDGGYVIEYTHAGVTNLELCTGDAALSQPIHRAGDSEVVNLVCPAAIRPPLSEHQRLLSDLSIHLGQSALADAADAADITLLARASGWDGRLVALAAKAAAMARITDVPEHAVYALLRAGMTDDPHQLARMHPAILDRAFGITKSARVAALTAAQIREAKSALAAYSRRLRLDSPAAPGTHSTIGELLAISGLDQAGQQAFEKVVAQHRGPYADMWARARENGLSEAQIAGLQVQGKLAQLTLNNAPLIAALHRDSAGHDLASWLTARDLHTAQGWTAYLSASGVDCPQESYPAELARRVRQAAPEHVLARRIETGELPLPPDTAQALRHAIERGFRLGVTPARTFLHQHPEVLDDAKDPQETADALEALHRVWQLSTDDTVVRRLLEIGLTSSDVITGVDSAAFAARHPRALGGVAPEVHRRARVIGAAVRESFATTPDPALAGVSALSSAAYLVDLLQFLENGSPDAFEVLLQRRPDLPHVELTGARAETEVPYREAVDEILAACTGSLPEEHPADLPREQLLELFAPDSVVIDAQTLAERLGVPRAELTGLWSGDYSTFARALGLTAAQVNVLIELSGVDPAVAPVQAVRFAELLEILPLGVDELATILRGREPGPSRLGLVRRLSAEIKRVRAEHRVPEDGLELTDDVIAQKVALAFPPEVAATFLGMWTGTIPYRADLPAAEADRLEPVVFAAETALTVHFDSVRGRQHLIHHGVLTPERAADLKARYPIPLFAELLEQIEPQPLDYFEWYLQEPVGFFAPDEFSVLFGEPPAGDPLDREAWERQRRSTLALALLPHLQDSLIRTVIAKALAAELDNPLVAALLTDEMTATFAEAATPGFTEDGPVLSGYLTAPASGMYRFVADRAAELRFDHLAEPLANGAHGEFPPVELLAGRTYALELVAEDSPARLDVIGENLPRGPVNRLACHPHATVERIERACTRLKKALRLAAAFELGDAELRYFTLPPFPAGPGEAMLGLDSLQPLLGHAALRRELPVDGLVEVYRSGSLERFAELTRRSPAEVREAAEALGETDWLRLWRVLAFSGRVGVSPTVLKGHATAAPQRRDILIAQLLGRNGLASPDELYAHLLLDPDRQTPTTRLQLAISSVQAFVQRSLLGLEPAVPPSAINAERWESLRSRTGWETQRRTYLWPEHWLEPELRDDRSAQFAALEADLLSGEVTPEQAEELYAAAWDSLAGVQIVSSCVDGGTVHLLGRTPHEPRQWSWRRREGRVWTPWEPVPVAITGDHALIAVWQGRPHVFWLTAGDRVRLHWTSRTAGQWSEPSHATPSLPVPELPWEQVHVHAVVGDELVIHLSTGGTPPQTRMPFYAPDPARVTGAFHLSGPALQATVRPESRPPHAPPFSWNGVQGTRYRGRGPLTLWRHGAPRGLNTSPPDAEFSIVAAPDGVTFFHQDAHRVSCIELSADGSPFTEWDGWIITASQQSTYEEPRVEPFRRTTPEAISAAALYPLAPSTVDDLTGGMLAVQFGGALIHG